MANTTVYPFGTGGSLPSSIGIINDLTTGGSNKALSAEQGKILNTKCERDVWTLVGSGSVSTASITSGGYIYYSISLAVGKYKVVVTFPEAAGVTTGVWINSSSTTRATLTTEAELDGQTHEYVGTITQTANRIVFGVFDGEDYGTIRVSVYAYGGAESAIDICEDIEGALDTKANIITVDMTDRVGNLTRGGYNVSATIDNYITISPDSSDAHNGVVTIVQPGTSIRFGYYIGKLPAGYRADISFDVLYTGTGVTTCKYNAAGGTIWSRANGDTVLGNVNITGNSTAVTHTYRPDSGVGTYLMWHISDLNAGDTLTISNFRAIMSVDVDLMYEMLNTLESSTISAVQSDPGIVAPSSSLPPIYGYERYMSVQGTQGAGITGDYLAVALNKTINLYNMSTKEQIQSGITMPTFPISNAHFNTVNFGVEKYDSSDALPLLYLSSGYANSNSDTQIYVCRLAGELGSMSMSLVQTITIDHTSTSSWTEGVIDTENQRLWVKYGACSYMCWDLPALSAGDITLTSGTAIEQFALTQVPYAFGTSSISYQGHCFKHGKIWCAAGVPTYGTETDEQSKIIVVDTHNKCRCAIVSLADMGLKNNNSTTYESEAVFFWNNDLYVCYRSFIAKIIKLSSY